MHGEFPTSIVDAPEGDLTVLNDYRHVLAEVPGHQGRGVDLGAVFPGYTGHEPLGLVA